MWFPTAACSSEFFRSDFDISHNTTMQNQLKPAPQRGPSLGQRRVAGGGTPRDSLLCGGPPPTAVRPVSSQRKTTRRLSCLVGKVYREGACFISRSTPPTTTRPRDQARSKGACHASPCQHCRAAVTARYAHSPRGGPCLRRERPRRAGKAAPGLGPCGGLVPAVQKRHLLVGVGVGSQQPHFPPPGGRRVKAPLAGWMGGGLGGQVSVFSPVHFPLSKTFPTPFAVILRPLT
ncbi:unnamed protein product [Rangifer tarandus platyrhynchus]|uniref:Uncharacterized protein n=2 Tax=Rangifer tarandus platyrhynchus TaxID=3082113 RepID=A0ABN8YYU7_RANTA|nr:unnamed protein product [Rangifer tarandus platyrhynchus]CAI9693739.1 unnamed protein product [Rangifer tarandus platyrhynchus]